MASLWPQHHILLSGQPPEMPVGRDIYKRNIMLRILSTLGLRQKVHCLYKSLTTILIFNLIGVGVGFQKEFLLSQYKGKMMK